MGKYLDLDDVAATDPLAWEELQSLRAEVAVLRRLERPVRADKSEFYDKSHFCDGINCKHCEQMNALKEIDEFDAKRREGK